MLLLPLVQHIGNKDVVVGVVQAINKKAESKASVTILDNLLQLAGCRKEIKGFSEFDMDMIKMLGDQVAQILKGFQMDAMCDTDVLWNAFQLLQLSNTSARNKTDDLTALPRLGTRTCSKRATRTTRPR